MSDLRAAETLIGMPIRLRQPAPFVSCLTAASFALVLVACGEAQDGPKNLGNTGDESVVGGPAPPAHASDFLGTWIGEVEDPLAVTEGSARTIQQFPSGSTQIRLEYLWVPEESPPQVRSTLTFGAGPPPATPGDPDVGYPPGAGYLTRLTSDIPSRAVLPPTEGFPYSAWAAAALDLTTVDEELPEGIMRFWFSPHEVFTGWCSQQVPHLVNEYGGFSCLRGYDYSLTVSDIDLAQCTIVPVLFPEAPRTRGIAPESVDCDKLFLCTLSQGPICSCSEYGCGVDNASVGLFLRRDGEGLVGSFTQGVFSGLDGRLSTLGTVRFRRE